MAFTEVTELTPKVPATVGQPIVDLKNSQEQSSLLSSWLAHHISSIILGDCLQLPADASGIQIAAITAVLGASFVLLCHIDILLAKRHSLRPEAVRRLGIGVLALIVARDREFRIVLVALRQRRGCSLFKLDGTSGHGGGESGHEGENSWCHKHFERFV